MQLQIPEIHTPPVRFMEHRWGQRVPVHVPVHLVDPSKAGIPAVLRDASVSGGFIETDVELPVHARVSILVLGGTGAARRAIEVPACVTRIARQGFGVEWCDMAAPPILELLRATGAELAYLTARDRVFS